MPVKEAASEREPTVAFTPQPANEDHHERVPLIKFLGKRSHVKVATILTPPNQTATAPAKVPVLTKQKVVAKSKTDLEFTDLKGGAWYGRPKFTAEEVEAIESGGATSVIL